MSLNVKPVTIADAPRDLESLKTLQRFQQTRLAVELGEKKIDVWAELTKGQESPNLNLGALKSAFLSCPDDLRAEILLKGLSDYDAQNGAAPAAPKPVKKAPAPVALPEAAAEAAPVSEPAPKARRAPAKAAPAPVALPSEAAPVTLLGAVSQSLSGIDAAIASLAESVDQVKEEARASRGDAQATLNQLVMQQEQLATNQQVVIGMLGLLLKQVLGTNDVSDFLVDASDAAQQISVALEQAAPAGDEGKD